MPLQATPPQSHGQVNPFAASDDGTSWEARVQAGARGCALNQSLKHLHDLRRNLWHQECLVHAF